MKKLALIAALVAVHFGASAQSTYAIPNPLMKPAGRDQRPQDQGQSQKAPTARHIEPAGQGASPNLLSPLPEAMSKAGNGADTAVVDNLSRYTVTAILGEFAILRTHVGESSLSPNQSGLQTGQAPVSNLSATNNQTADRSTRARQQMLRVRTGLPVIVAGVSVLPTVMGSQVDFSLPGAPGVIYTASLESQSGIGDTLQPSAKEVMDPAMPARVAPRQTGGVSNGSLSTNAQPMAGQLNGVQSLGASAQR